jgi:hypothetical protein
MSSNLIQHLVIVVIVAGAVAWVGWELWKTFSPRAGGSCGCSSCPVKKGLMKTSRGVDSREIPVTLRRPAGR